MGITPSARAPEEHPGGVSLVVAVALVWLVIAGSLALLLGAVTCLRSTRREEDLAPTVAPAGLLPAPRTAAASPPAAVVTALR